MRVAIAGSSGLIGTALRASLLRDGHDVVRLVRREPRAPGEVGWSPATFGLGTDALDGVDAVVNLCGVGIGDRPWSGQFRQTLRDSRITPTEALIDAVVERGVSTVLNASATGIYGYTSGEVVTERSPAGTGFLADLVSDWEQAATAGVSTPGCTTRVVLMRTAPVLSSSGGLLGKLRPLFRLGLGGRLGDGQQYLSWITLADHIRAMRHVLDGPATAVSGPVNFAAPHPVTNSEFTRAFAAALGTKARVSVPGRVLRTVAGGLAEEMLLGGQRAVPEVLTTSGFEFSHPTIDEGLAHVIR
ncbi:TIGR01777 family oxidoreductase [Williamsia sp. CHRR-6]|uniref:TIGR01777 family oxidoreductase n=1 Tax=Williamsia sp. CHRR-6 TaxID=2835871 RepID=UPI001BDB1585|nr:TIGR01777 family oxidoreductase [Williamsia sp. CHRR-6]MBT0565319.1 TIGR01777 family oxidoreductase [Williamsia sp. CHRR-6]